LDIMATGFEHFSTELILKESDMNSVQKFQLVPLAQKGGQKSSVGLNYWMFIAFVLIFATAVLAYLFIESNENGNEMKTKLEWYKENC
ncbi:MAG: hypothetical protein ACKO6L_03215, partial [Flavobacteriales bacterium]